MRAATRSRFSFPSNNHAASSSSLSKTVFTEIYNATGRSNIWWGRSNIWWRGRSFAASVPSESSKSPKGQKRTSKDERRILVKAFVEKYKASNGGKYPTASVAKKQVGGSYYFVKKILQEIEYQSKMPPTGKSNVSPLEKDVNNEEFVSSPKVEDVSSSESTAQLTCHKPSSRLKGDSGAIVADSMIDEVAINNFETNDRSSISDNKQLSKKASSPRKGHNNHSSFIVTNSHQTKVESKEVLHSYSEEPKDIERKEGRFEESVDLNCSEAEVVQKTHHEISKSDDSERDIYGENEDQLQKRSKIWGNLRSFADSIMNLWRKM